MHKRARHLFAFRSKKKQVLITNSMEDDTASIYSTSTHSSRITLVGGFTNDIDLALDLREVMTAYDDSGMDVTPKPIEDELYAPYFERLRVKALKHEVFQRALLAHREASLPRVGSLSRLGAFRVSMDDIIEGVGNENIQYDERSIYETDAYGSLYSFSLDEESVDYEEMPEVETEDFGRAVLRRTEEMLLYEQQSALVLRNTKAGKRAEEDNKTYEYITVGKGRLRLRDDSEAQTNYVLYKSRDCNTDYPGAINRSLIASSFDVYDLLQSTKKKKPVKRATTTIGGFSGEPVRQVVAVRSPLGESPSPEEQMANIARLSKFKTACMIVRRMLTGFTFEEPQKRFRDLTGDDMKAPVYMISYSVNLLFRFEAIATDKERKAVTDLAWCPRNSDVLAAGYGIFSFSAMHVPQSGYACVWNIKNPEFPERYFFFNVPVVCTSFSPMIGTLLAVGLYDGQIHVFDITEPNQPAIAVTNRRTSPTCEPVMMIKWIGTNIDERLQIEPFLSVMQNSSVTKHCIINSPYLLSYRQMGLERAEGRGDIFERMDQRTRVQANRHPQGLNMTLHPVQKDVYYVLTDEGCFHKCSTNYPHQHLEVIDVHKAGVTNMDFSPWSPSLYLTSGNDWKIRIWMDGVFKPLITLTNPNSTPVHSACWSRTHSTIIASVNRRTFDIWDIRRNLLYPMTSATIDSSFHTTFKLSNSGTGVALGNERGNILICSLDMFPFPSHRQHQVLQISVMKAIERDPALYHEVRIKGIKSYPGKRMKP